MSAAPAGEVLIREPSSHDDLHALYQLRLIQGQEMAHAPVNPFKVANRLLDAACRPETHTMLMAILDGQLVGYLLLERRTYDYSDAEFLIDFGFYVLPQHRGGDVGPELLRFARDLAEIEQLPLYIAILNPSRRRGLPTGVEKAASIIGFIPQGAFLAFGKESPDVLRLRREQASRDEDLDRQHGDHECSQLGEQQLDIAAGVADECEPGQSLVPQ